ncbi:MULTISPECIES: MspA family porin [unclassified Mycolicibacterium]|uniref:MspA family porin n=1 Tax=unclassified Mycolicibacterium TaxID=2636767 RepID=UPI0012DE7777|nr:hypothetical protein [Mycolicibacterium sp. CBMA 329]MUL87988.1 hypothetical protein [Mycolicibacterium sp. CBMA 331]MUM02319.1 hypothetical protein [Mycolicibacterium sp. CBMA 334]MUM26369.1 hypothetical protein [Mycolicibacterium sp. CBMA 295]MUM38285.1 hypothetical protein [Mycolicibacterium sp. CBMA 247]MUM44053.1 hypothetical protein [Mycolicibacterium sp. CBMA 294]
MSKDGGSTRVRDASVHVDACAGPANVRLFATVTISTSNSVDGFTIYSEIRPL